MDEGKAKNICLFGPQGSGKGTQAEKVTDLFGVPQVSPGNIFRKAVADGTELGKKVEAIMKEGILVPDEITNEMIRQRLQEEDCLNGFILDGYPRNVAQAEALDTMTALTHVIVIDITDEEAVRRLSQRRACNSCGVTYHLEYKPPRQEGVCDTCGKEIIHREDDMPEAIKKRLEIYHTETEPLYRRYEERGILCRFDGSGTIEEVWEEVQKCFF
ncbi:adenylate kinase [Patescibacteria group bacterium]